MKRVLVVSSILLLLLLLGCLPKQGEEQTAFAGEAIKTPTPPRSSLTVAVSCKDSDGGVKSEEKGKITVITSKGGKTSTETIYDVCLSGSQLTEYLCNGKIADKRTITCSTSCRDGACLPPPCTDYDRDGYGASGTILTPCPKSGIDCNDGDNRINLGAAEICDSKDNNCNGQIDEGIDLQSDVNNCGRCGNRCGNDRACFNGICKNKYAQLSIGTFPAQARVYVDNELKGTTPLSGKLNFNIVAGTHTLKMTKEGYEDLVVSNLAFEPESTFSNNYDLNIDADSRLGTALMNLVILSNPSDAEIYLDGELLLWKTPASFVLPTPLYQLWEITVKKDNYEKSKQIQYCYSGEESPNCHKNIPLCYKLNNPRSDESLSMCGE